MKSTAKSAIKSDSTPAMNAAAPVRQQQAKAQPEADPLAITAASPDDAFQSLVGLLSAFTANGRKMASIQLEIDGVLQDAIERVRVPFAELQLRELNIKQEIEAIARRNPQWFESAKGLVTPCGTVKLTSSNSLETGEDDAMTVNLIRRHCGEEADMYVRRSEAPNLDTLKLLPDGLLGKLGIRRVKEESFSVSAAKINLGKAVGKAAGKESK